MIIDQMLRGFEQCLEHRFICAIAIDHPDYDRALAKARNLVRGRRGWRCSGDALDNPTIAWETSNNEAAVTSLIKEVEGAVVYDRQLRQYLSPKASLA